MPTVSSVKKEGVELFHACIDEREKKLWNTLLQPSSVWRLTWENCGMRIVNCEMWNTNFEMRNENPELKIRNPQSAIRNYPSPIAFASRPSGRGAVFGKLSGESRGKRG